jgi:hypothetical protein
MATRIPNASRNAVTNGVVDLLDVGAGTGYIQIRTGTQPADPDDAASGTLLVTLQLNDPAFGAAVDGVADADVTPVPEATAVATGTAGWFRAYDDNDASVIDGSVTSTGGGGDMELNTTAIVSGVSVRVTAWSVTMPAG